MKKNKTKLDKCAGYSRQLKDEDDDALGRKR